MLMAATTLIGSFLLLLISFAGAQIGMSPCFFGRGTGGYNIPTSTQGGTCGFGPVKDEIKMYTDGYLTAPDDETYNGFPFLAGPLSIAGNPPGIGLACGECFELTGPSGRIIVMNADICDKPCSSCGNCQGSVGGPKGGPDVPDFDINQPVFAQIQNYSTGGNFALSYRKVTCPHPTGKNISFYFNLASEGNAQKTYFRIRFYNHKVGIAKAEVMSPLGAGSAAPNVWVALKRGWEGYFNWTDSGDIRPPFYIRVTSVTGQTIQFPQAINLKAGDPTFFPSGGRYYSGLQFSDPPAGYDGASATQCAFPQADPNIFVDTYGGAKSINWNNYGGPTQTIVTSGCLSGSCLQVPSMAAYELIQISSSINCVPFSVTAYKNLTFAVKSDGTNGGVGNLRVTWSQASFPAVPTSCSSGAGGGQTQSAAVSTSAYLPGGQITTSWQTVTIPLSVFATTGTFITLKLQNGGTVSPGYFFDNVKLVGPTQTWLTLLNNATTYVSAVPPPAPVAVPVTTPVVVPAPVPMTTPVNPPTAAPTATPTVVPAPVPAPTATPTVVPAPVLAPQASPVPDDTPVSPPAPSDGSESPPTNVGAIVGGVIGGIAALLLIAGIVVYFVFIRGSDALEDI